MNEKKIPLYNPLLRNFSYPWKDDENKEHILTMYAREMTYFPPYQAHFMAKHLADEIINDEGMKPNYEDKLKEVMKRIYINE